MYAFSGAEDFDEENNPFSCYLCDVGFKDEVSLRKHVENCGKTFYCAKCHDTFKSKQNLEEHIISVHDGSTAVYGNKTQFDCGICQLTFSSKQSYFTHISSVHVAANEYVHEGKKYFHEGKEYVHEETKPTYQVVMSSQDKTEPTLDENNLIFEESDTIIEHVELYERKNNGVNTERKYSLQPNEKSRYPCPICNDIYINLESLTNHISLFHDKLNECLKCDFVFSSRENLREHVKSVHHHIDLHQCKYCNMKVKTQISLKKHISRFHEGRNPFECLQCDMKYKTSISLKKHIHKVHESVTSTRKDSITCNIAIKNYRNATSLKPFECAVCKRCFSAKQMLMVHYDKIHESKQQEVVKPVHDGEKQATETEPIHKQKQSEEIQHVNEGKQKKLAKCNLCSIICLNNRELKNHIKRVHISGLTETYLCEPCHMSFMSEEQFTEHARIIHNEKDENVEIQEVTDLTVHEKKNNFYGKICSKSFELELKKLRKEHLHEENEYIHEGKDNFQVEKEYVHEGKENVHEENYNVHEGKVYFLEDYVISNPDGTFRLEVYDEEIQPAEPEPVLHEGKQSEEIQPVHEVKQPSEIKSLHEEKQPEEITIVHQEKVHEENYNIHEGKVYVLEDYVTANPDRTFQLEVYDEEIQPEEPKTVLHEEKNLEEIEPVHEVKQTNENKPPHEGKQPEEIAIVYQENVYEVNNPTKKEEKSPDKKYVTYNPHEKYKRMVKAIYGPDSTTFKCTICSAVFNILSNAIRHFQTVHEKLKPFECAVCKRCFSTKYVLIKHNARVHDGNKPFECSQCDEKYKRKTALRKHVHEFHKEINAVKKYTKKPTKNGKKTTSKENVIANPFEYLHTNPDGTFRCTLCNTVFKQLNIMTRHFHAVHEKQEKFECAVCKKCFYSEPVLMEHYAQLHDGKQLKEIEPEGKESVNAANNPNKKKEINIAEEYISANPDGNLTLEDIVSSSLEKENPAFDVTYPVHNRKQLKDIELSIEESESLSEANNPAKKRKMNIAKAYLSSNPDRNLDLVEIVPSFLDKENLESDVKETFSVGVEVSHDRNDPGHEGKQPKKIKLDHEGKQSKEIELVHKVKQPEHIATLHEEEKSVVEASKHVQNRNKITADECVVANPDGTFQCTVCNAIVKQRRNFIRHFQTVHEKLKPFQCAECKKCFSSKQETMRHNNLHHRCRFCDMIFSKFHQLNNHLLQIHSTDVKLFLRNKSNTSNEQTNDGKIEDNTKIKNQNQKKCNFCNECLQNKPALDDHIKKFHDVEAKHLFGTGVTNSKVHEEKKQDTQQCNFCNMFMSNSQVLDGHIKQFHAAETQCILENTVKNQCSFCKRLFSNYNRLNNHIREFHPAEAGLFMGKITIPQKNRFVIKR